MEEHKCIYEGRWSKLETRIDLWLDRISKHVNDGDKEGGFRDRLLILEKEISELKKRFWIGSAIGGVIGALIGSGSRDILLVFLNWVVGK